MIWPHDRSSRKSAGNSQILLLLIMYFFCSRRNIEVDTTAVLAVRFTDHRREEKCRGYHDQELYFVVSSVSSLKKSQVDCAAGDMVDRTSTEEAFVRLF